MQASSNWELVDQGGTTASYQCPRTSINKSSCADIHQLRISQINSLPNRQQNRNLLYIENGWHNKPNNACFIKRDLGSLVEKERNYFSQIPCQCSKQGGRLGVTKQQELLGLETVSSDLSKNQVSVCSSPDRSLSITSMPSARKRSFLETRPTHQGRGCNAIKLVSSFRTYPVPLPHFLLDSKSLTEDNTGPSSCNDTCSTNLSDTTLVPKASTIIDGQSNHHTSYAKSIAKWTKAGSSISGK